MPMPLFRPDLLLAKARKRVGRTFNRLDDPCPVTCTTRGAFCALLGSNFFRRPLLPQFSSPGRRDRQRCTLLSFAQRRASSSLEDHRTLVRTSPTSSPVGIGRRTRLIIP